jgi:hypothetical protein
MVDASNAASAEFPGTLGGYRFRVEKNGSVSAVNSVGGRSRFPDWASFWNTAAGNSAANSISIRNESAASLAFKIAFWVHQVFLGIPSVWIGIDLVTNGKTEGIINAMGLLLAWIGGTLVWGLAALMYRRPAFELPNIVSVIAENVARLERLETHTASVSAVADALSEERQRRVL